MADHCDTCYCSAPKLYCGVKKKLFVKISLGLASISFIGMGFTMVSHLVRNQFEGWSIMEIVTFLSCLGSFTTTVLIILYVEMALFGEFLWLILCGVYEYFWDFLRYIRDRIVTWPCVLLSRVGALVGVHPQQQEVSASDSESDDEKPPLPPKSRNVTEAARSVPFQMARPESSQGSGPSSAQSDDNDIESQFLGMTHGGKESTTSSGKPGSRSKKMSQKERFRKMIESLASMSSIEEEESSSSEAAGIKIPLSVLTENPGSSAASEEATSFTESPPTEGEEKKTYRTAKIRETYKQISGSRSSSRETSTRDKQRRLKNSSVSNVRVFGSPTRQSFGSDETGSEQSLEQASTSRYVPASMLLCHPSTSQLNEGQRIQTAGEQASFAEPSSPKRHSKTLDTQKDRGQTSSYVRHSELEKQSREYGVVEAEREQSITEQPLSSIYVKFAVPQRERKDLTPTSGFAGSLRRTQARSIEKIHGIPDQTSTSYISLPELEKQSEEFDTRGTKRKQISPEHPSASRFVRILTSPDETEENILTSSQRQARSSDFGRVQLNEVPASTSYEGLPPLKTQPTESSSIGTGTEQSSRVHRQPMSSYVKFSVPLSQAREQSETAEFSASESQIEARGVENKQESPGQSSSYVALQVLQQQSGKSVPRKTEMQEISLEQPSSSGYVPVSVAREQSATAEFSGSKSQMQARGVENKQGSPGQSPASYVALQVLEQQSGKSGTRETEKQEISPEQPRYVPVSVLQTQVQACSIDESKQIQAIRKHASETGRLTLQKESEREKKLKNVEQASAAGFYGVTTQTGDSKESPKLISSGYAPVQKVAEKSGSGAIPKRQERQRETLSSISVRPYPLSKTRWVEKKGSMVEGTSGSSMHGRMDPTPDIQKTQNIEDTSRAYVPHSALRLEPTLTQETERIILRTRTERLQRSSKDSPTERKVKTQKESFLSLNLASGGLVINKIKLEEDETILSSTVAPCESTFVYDQPADVLDLSHIKVPLPGNDKESKKNEDDGQN